MFVACGSAASGTDARVRRSDRASGQCMTDSTPNAKERAGQVLLALLIAAAAVGAVLLGLYTSIFCVAGENSEPCSAAETKQVWVAIAGLVPVAFLVAEALRPGGGPERWLVVTLVVYCIWAALFIFG